MEKIIVWIFFVLGLICAIIRLVLTLINIPW